MAKQANQNAKKDNPATSFLHIRVTPKEKSNWVRAAQKADQKLAEWVRDNLNQNSHKS